MCNFFLITFSYSQAIIQHLKKKSKFSVWNEPSSKISIIFLHKGTICWWIEFINRWPQNECINWNEMKIQCHCQLGYFAIQFKDNDYYYLLHTENASVWNFPQRSSILRYACSFLDLFVYEALIIREPLITAIVCYFNWASFSIGLLEYHHHLLRLQ